MTFFVRPGRLFGVLFLFLCLSCHGMMALAEKIPEEKDEVTRTMTMQFVLHHAYLHNPTLKSARAELRAVEEQLPQAYAGWKPTVLSELSVTSTDISGSNFGGGDGSTARDVNLKLDQPLFRGGTTFAEVAAARHTIESQKSLLASTEQDILLAATTAYMDVLRDQALVRLARNNREVIQQELEATKDRFDVGELTRTDVSQAEARLARADSDVITEGSNLNSSMAVFEEITGLVPGALSSPGLTFDSMPQTLDEAAMQAEQTSPLVLSALNAHRASEKDVDGVFGELLPEVGLFSSWNRTYDPAPGLIEEQTTKTFGLSATIPLYQAGSVRSRVREAKHRANQRYMEILETKRQVRQTVITDWSSLQAAQAEIRSRQAQVDASRVAQEGVRAEMELGSRTVLDALDADQELLDAEVALVTSQRNEVVARFSLLSTLGQLTPETLGFPNDLLSHKENHANMELENFETNVDRLQEVE